MSKYLHKNDEIDDGDIRATKNPSENSRVKNSKLLRYQKVYRGKKLKLKST